MASGSWGSSGSDTWFNNPVSTGITLADDEYPNGTISVNISSGSGRYWQRRDSDVNRYMNFYLCDSSGNNTIYLWKVSGFNSQSKFLYSPTSTTINNTSQTLKGKTIYVKGTGQAYYTGTYGKITITINTSKATHTITCNTDGNGTLTSSVASASSGTVISLTPTPNTGYQFSSYTSNPSLTITNNQFTMPSSAVTITANFTPKSYLITLVESPSGCGTVTGGGTYSYGSTVNITATPEPGYIFTRWNTTAGTIANSTSASTTFTVPNSTATITAIFTAYGEYDIECISSPTNGGSVTGEGSYTAGSNVTLTATPALGYNFVAWRTSGGSLSNFTANPTVLTVPAKNCIVTAIFRDNSTHVNSGDISWVTGNGYITISANMIQNSQSGTKYPATIKLYLGIVE